MVIRLGIYMKTPNANLPTIKLRYKYYTTTKKKNLVETTMPLYYRIAHIMLLLAYFNHTVLFLYNFSTHFIKKLHHFIFNSLKVSALYLVNLHMTYYVVTGSPLVCLLPPYTGLLPYNSRLNSYKIDRLSIFSFFLNCENLI